MSETDKPVYLTVGINGFFFIFMRILNPDYFSIGKHNLSSIKCYDYEGT